MNENISLTATIFITDRCNLACKYCYEENKQYQTIKKYSNGVPQGEDFIPFRNKIAYCFIDRPQRASFLLICRAVSVCHMFPVSL